MLLQSKALWASPVFVCLFMLNLSAQGKGNPPDHANNPIPESLTVSVNCDANGSIDEALQRSAETLTIEISGICDEDVVVTRSQVILRGSDPIDDGIRGTGTPDVWPLELRNVVDVSVENLQITGGNASGLLATGTLATQTREVRVLNALISDNGSCGVHVDAGQLAIRDSEISGNGVCAIASRDHAFASCENCILDQREPASGGGVVAVSSINHSRILISDSSIAGSFALFEKSSLELIGVDQTDVVGFNLVLDDSLIRTFASESAVTTIESPVLVARFGKAHLADTEIIPTTGGPLSGIICSTGGQVACGEGVIGSVGPPCGDLCEVQ